MLKRIAACLDTALVWADHASLWLARAGGFLILITVGMVTIEILSRRLFGRSAVPATELSGYIMAISASWAFAFTLFRKAHIRIDAVYLLFPVPVRSMLDLLALLTLALFCVLVVGASLDVAMSSLHRGSTANTPLQTPMWIPQMLWALGLCWFAFAVGLLLLRVLLGLVMLDPRAVQRVAGSPTLDDQISAEIREDAVTRQSPDQSPAPSGARAGHDPATSGFGDDVYREEKA